MACPRTDPLEPDKIAANLKTKRIGRKILVYSSTSSTNDIAAEYARNRDNDGLAVFAEEQTAGRGRSGNKWLSAAGDSILCSIVLTDCYLSHELLSLAAAVAVAEAVGHPAKVKWPNDTILNGKKAAGILVESRQDDGSIARIIGVGINCHQKPHSFPPELQSLATSIDIETRTTCDRISLAKRLLVCLDHWLETAEKDTAKIMNKWRRLSVQFGHRVTLLHDGRKFNGNCIGIDPQKGLILQLDSGGTRIFNAAQTIIVK